LLLLFKAYKSVFFVVNNNLFLNMETNQENPISPQPEQKDNNMVRNVVIAIVVLLVLVLVVLALVGSRSVMPDQGQIEDEFVGGGTAPLSDEELEAIFRGMEQDAAEVEPLSDEELEAIFRGMEQDATESVPLSNEEIEAILRGME